MKKEAPKSKRPWTEFSLCPKHNVFYKSCKCPRPGSRKKEEVVAEMEDMDGSEE